MAAELTLAAIPRVLDDDEVPFVLAFGADPRPCLEVDDVEFRRGIDRVTISWKFGSLRLRSVVMEAGGASYLMASAGPMLIEWWPLLERQGAHPVRPLLSAGVTHTAQVFTVEGLSAEVSVVPPSPDGDMVAAVIGFQGGFTDDILFVAHARSLAVIKAALLILGEYRTLVNPVPDVYVESGGATVALEAVLDAAVEAAAAIAWTHS